MIRTASILRPLAICLAMVGWPVTGHAQEGGPPSEPRPEARSEARGLPFAAFLNENELRDLFDFMRDAVIAHMKEEEPPGLPPELMFKLEVMKQRMLREGDLAVRMMLFALQRELERARLEMERRQRERETGPRQAPPPPSVPPGERTRT